jgi:hypothetical protein
MLADSVNIFVKTLLGCKLPTPREVVEELASSRVVELCLIVIELPLYIVELRIAYRVLMPTSLKSSPLDIVLS